MGGPAKYPEEFRREAVALYRSSDRSRAEVAKSSGISDGSLDASERAELGRLRKENKDPRTDRQILRNSSCPVFLNR